MNQATIDAVALSVRSLSMDAVQKANSGHPGLPMGCAELGALLYGQTLRYNPADPAWPNRDRFVLSAGHGSMFLYSLLHLAGFAVSMADLKAFRQVGSKTPGHPEYGHTAGVETTTGPLGQGISNAVGLAIAERMAAGTYNTAAHTIIDHYTCVLAGDGDMMEGISSEACSLAGHLGLGRLIAFYDDNDISIDGSTDITFTEDVGKRFEAYGWQVQRADGYDVPAIERAIAAAKAEGGRPSLIVLKTVIGKGSPNKAGTSKVHGAPLGADEVAATRKALGLAEDQEFFVHPDAAAHFAKRRSELAAEYDRWTALFTEWRKANPELASRWDASARGGVDFLKAAKLPDAPAGEKVASRKASHRVLNAIADAMPCLVGGSADLAESNLTAMPHGVFSTETPTGRTINFGVREHGMGAIANGLALYGVWRPFCATFLVFSDYMRPSIRLAAIMGLPVVYVFTHDSIFVGEDGPTHEPIEHVAALRTIPNLRVLRPADAEETGEAWLMAIERTDGPTALILTRQNLATFAKPAGWKESMRHGAYIARDTDGPPDVVVAASGSEVGLALGVAESLEAKKARVVSVPSLELLKAQPPSVRARLFPAGVRVVTAEVGIGMGWEAVATSAADVFSLERYGASGPGDKVAEHLGYTAAALRKLVEA